MGRRHAPRHHRMARAHHPASARIIVVIIARPHHLRTHDRCCNHTCTHACPLRTSSTVTCATPSLSRVHSRRRPCSSAFHAVLAVSHVRSDDHRTRRHRPRRHRHHPSTLGTPRTAAHLAAPAARPQQLQATASRTRGATPTASRRAARCSLARVAAAAALAAALARALSTCVAARSALSSSSSSSGRRLVGNGHSAHRA
jgi:hypothetical protein